MATLMTLYMTLCIAALAFLAGTIIGWALNDIRADQRKHLDEQ